MYRRFNADDAAKLEKYMEKSRRILKWGNEEFKLDCGSKAAFEKEEKALARYTLKIDGFLFVFVSLVLLEVTSQHCASH